jgi:glycine hydroxymethyltransferase
MAVCTYEMMEFGDQYAEDTIKNAQALASELDRHGFDVQAEEFGFTQSHQVALNVKEFRGGEGVSRTLELNDIIVNMNMLPHEPLGNHDHPEGIRIGVQEMTRFGMREDEMSRIAELIKECIIDKKVVKEGVNRSRSEYQTVRYSYDSIEKKIETDSIKKTEKN